MEKKLDEQQQDATVWPPPIPSDIKPVTPHTAHSYRNGNLLIIRICESLIVSFLISLPLAIFADIYTDGHYRAIDRKDIDADVIFCVTLIGSLLGFLISLNLFLRRPCNETATPS